MMGLSLSIILCVVSVASSLASDWLIADMCFVFPESKCVLPLWAPRDPNVADVRVGLGLEAEG